MYESQTVPSSSNRVRRKKVTSSILNSVSVEVNLSVSRDSTWAELTVHHWHSHSEMKCIIVVLVLCQVIGSSSLHVLVTSDARHNEISGIQQLLCSSEESNKISNVTSLNWGQYARKKSPILEITHFLKIPFENRNCSGPSAEATTAGVPSPDTTILSTATRKCSLAEHWAINSLLTHNQRLPEWN